MAITGRERVLTALNHEEPDRVPVIIGACNPTGMKAQPYRGLARADWQQGPRGVPVRLAGAGHGPAG